MANDGEGRAITQDALDRIRRVADEWLRENLDGTPRSMRVIFTTMHAVRTVIQGGPGAPPLPPDPRLYYTVVIEGDFSLREYPTRTGNWAALHVLPSFEVQGIRLGQREQLPSTYTLDGLGPVYSLM